MGRNSKRRREEKRQQQQRQQQELAKRELLQKAQQNKIRVPEKVEKPSIAPMPGVPTGMPNFRAAAETKDIVSHIKGKRVIAFLQETFDCCSEKCILEYVPFFQQDGYACLLIPRQQYTDILKYLSNYVVLFRTGYKDASKPEVMKIMEYLQHIKGLGIRVVYYADDLIFWSNNGAPLALIQYCDAVIVANESLKDVLINKAQLSKPIIVVPTHISLAQYDSLPSISPKPLSDRFKVLLTSGGRIGINHAYEICEIANEDPELAKNVEWVFNCSGVAQLRSVVNKFRNLKKTYIDWIGLQQYYSLTKSVNVIIHPANPHDLDYMCPEDQQQAWLDSKSEVKYTLAGAAGIPIISSPTAAYKKAIREGENGFIADTPAEFVQKIKLLLNNSELCATVGKTARKDVETNYNITQRYPRYRDAITGAISKEDIAMFTGPRSSVNSVFIPAIEGGPRTFYENMKRVLPQIGNKWAVTDMLDKADAAIAIAFVAADVIMKEKAKRPGMKLLYRLDGLPMDFSGQLELTNLKTMHDLFKIADVFVWQSKHCLNMWRERNLVPNEINPEGPIIHNGVDLTIFSRDGQKYLLPRPRKYNFLNLNWSTFPHKRLDILKETIRSYETNPDVLFYLIGNYVSTSQIQNVNYWKDVSNVIYLGPMRNQTLEAKRMLASIYRTAYALIFTSEMEGSPNTVLEALGCGCPVIYNANVDIVPEILGEACLPLERMADIFEMEKRQAIINKMVGIDEQYSMENCVRKYLEVLG